MPADAPTAPPPAAPKAPAPATPAPRPAAPKAPPPAAKTAAAPSGERPRLTMTSASFTPPIIVMNAVEGWGKTSLGAHAEKAAVLMAGNETGYLTLVGGGRAPKIPSVRLQAWQHTLDTLDDLIRDPQGIKTLVLDAMGGFERQCHEHVCATEYGGDWGERGFTAFHKGFELSITEWLKLLSRLETLRNRHGVTILVLSHAKVETFKNPMGADFDRYVADCHKKTWSATSRWADIVLFGNFITVVVGGTTGEKAKKGKGIGGSERVIYTERRDAFDAKNRHGLPPEIEMPCDGNKTDLENIADGWKTLWAAIKGESA